MILFVLVFI